MTTHLEPCPWCGHVGVDFVYPSTHRWLAPECQKCEARGPEVRIRTDAGSRDACVEATKPDAIAAWNRRTTLRQPCFDPPDCETIPYQDRRGV